MATRTLGLTGRDYSTLAAWSSYVNALSLSENEFCDVYNDGGAVADTVSVTIGGWTANGFTVTLRPATGQGIGDHASKLTNALRYNASNGAAFTNNVGYTDAYRLGSASLIVTGLQFNATASTASSTIKIWLGTTVNRCILQKESGAGYVVSQNGTNFTINDSLIFHAGSGGGVQTTDTGVVLNGCTIATTGASGIGIAQTYSVNPVVKNTAVYGFVTDFQNTAGGGTTNNATDKGTFGGTGWGTSGQTSLSSADFENVGSGTADWRIKSSSTKLIDTGAGATGSGSDVVGTTRGATYDIGAWEVSASGSTAQGTTVTATTSIQGGTATGGVAAGSFNLNSSTYAFKRNNTTLIASTAATFWVSNTTTGALVGSAITGLSTNASGIVTSPVTNASVVSGTTYRLNYKFASGEYGVVELEAV